MTHGINNGLVCAHRAVPSGGHFIAAHGRGRGAARSSGACSPSTCARSWTTPTSPWAGNYAEYEMRGVPLRIRSARDLGDSQCHRPAATAGKKTFVALDTLERGQGLPTASRRLCRKSGSESGGEHLRPVSRRSRKWPPTRRLHARSGAAAASASLGMKERRAFPPLACRCASPYRRQVCSAARKPDGHLLGVATPGQGGRSPLIPLASEIRSLAAQGAWVEFLPHASCLKRFH